MLVKIYIKVEVIYRMKKKICLKIKVICFGMLNKKWKKKIGKIENFIYMIGKWCLLFDIVIISDVIIGYF